MEIDLKGMNITKKGKHLIDELNEVYKGLKGITELQNKLEKKLGVNKIIIVPGNSSEDELILKEMGKITSSNILKLIQPNDVIGITGGNTMANVAEEMPESDVPNDVMVIPARGGLGRELETQANAIAAKIGKKLGGNYRLLNVPDSLGKEALEVIIKNDEVKEAMELINNINLLVFGIGRADTMAHRRNLPGDRIKEILNLGAVAEAFGHYFDINGNEIWEYETIGISIEKFKSTKNVIGVAGGPEKAESIIAITSIRKDMTIVTDESAALKILELI